MTENAEPAELEDAGDLDDVDPAELASQRVTNTILEKELQKEEGLLRDAEDRLKKAREQIDNLSYVLPPLKEHAEMLKQEVRDVEMNTRSLVEAKKSADLENQELRKMLKKELEAYNKMRGVVLRHELSRLASEKGADPSIVGLAKNSAALQSRLVELKAELAKPPEEKKKGPKPRLPPDSAQARGRAYTVPESARPRSPKPKPKSKSPEPPSRKQLSSREERDRARQKAGLKPLSRPEEKSPIRSKSPIEARQGARLPLAGHSRGPYMSEHMKKGLKTAYGISGAGREPADLAEREPWRDPTVGAVSGGLLSGSASGNIKASPGRNRTGGATGEKLEDKAKDARGGQLNEAFNAGSPDVQPRRGKDGTIKPAWAVVVREEIPRGPNVPHSGKLRNPPPGKMKPEVVEVPLGGRYDPKDPIRDPRFGGAPQAAMSFNERNPDYLQLTPHQVAARKDLHSVVPPEAKKEPTQGSTPFSPRSEAKGRYYTKNAPAPGMQQDLGSQSPARYASPAPAASPGRSPSPAYTPPPGAGRQPPPQSRSPAPAASREPRGSPASTAASDLRGAPPAPALGQPTPASRTPPPSTRQPATRQQFAPEPRTEAEPPAPSAPAAAPRSRTRQAEPEAPARQETAKADRAGRSPARPAQVGQYGGALPGAKPVVVKTAVLGGGKDTQLCPLCEGGRDELEHVLQCSVAAPVVQEWRRALEVQRVPVRIETILDPPDQVLLPTLQLVQEIHRMRQAAGVETAMPPR